MFISSHGGEFPSDNFLQQERTTLDHSNRIKRELPRLGKKGDSSSTNSNSTSSDKMVYPNNHTSKNMDEVTILEENFNNLQLLTSIRCSIPLMIANFRSKLKKEGKNPWELDQNSIQKFKVIGLGSYGVVSKGTLTIKLDSDKEPTKMQIAIKEIIKNQENKRYHLLKEAKLLKKLSHPKIVSFIGIISQKNQAAIITEFMENGSLLTFLRNGR